MIVVLSFVVVVLLLLLLGWLGFFVVCVGFFFGFFKVASDFRKSLK